MTDQGDLADRCLMLEAERNKYRVALEQILDVPADAEVPRDDRWEAMVEIAEEALGE